MASSPITSEGGSGLEDLENELVFQKTLLVSIREQEDTPSNRETTSRIQAEVSRLKKALSQAQNSGRSSLPTMQQNAQALSFGASLSAAQRKRSFGSSHLGPVPIGRPGSKAQRHLPPSSSYNSLDDDPFDEADIIDLTGDDDVLGDAVKKQQDEANRLRRNKSEEEEGRKLALQYHQRTPQGLTVPVYGSNFPQHQPADLGQNSSFGVQPHFPFGVPARNIKAEPAPSLGSSFGHSSLGPGHIKPEPSSNLGHRFGQPSSLNAGHVKTERFYNRDNVGNGFKREGGWDSNYQMPGFFPQDGIPNRTHYQQPVNLPHHPTSHYLLSRTEQARQEALASQVFANPYGGGPSASTFSLNQVQPLRTMAAYSTPLPGFARPGYYQNDSYSASTPSAPGSSLGSIISRTNEYNFEDLTDSSGNHLGSSLVDFLNDYTNDPRKSKKDIENLLSNIRPDMEIPEEERGETPEALRYPLYPHQQLALKWMKDMEMGTNKGGILADDMGLGKTISTLSLMVTRQSDDSIKTNLIIGPVSLIKQWEAEIKKKLKSTHQLKVFCLHGKTKKTTYQQIRDNDVVLTTFGSIAAELKRYENHTEERKKSEAYNPADDLALQSICPILHPRSKFYRVILDEAQCIKNKDTQNSKGVAQIEATYRWCLTGTPMMNGVHELFPLIRFLRIKPYSEYKKFQLAFRCLTSSSSRTEYQKNDAMQQLRVVLKAVMLRRTKSTLIDGKPIVTLPEKTQLEEEAVFSEDELKFYKDLESRSQVQFNKYLRQGTVGKNYSNILVLLLRLRQACCHPHLMDFEVDGGVEVAEELMMKLAETMQPAVVARIKDTTGEGFDCPICLDPVLNPTLMLPCGHHLCSEDWVGIANLAAEDSVRSGNEKTTVNCPNCRQAVDPAKIIDLMTFRKVYMPETLPPPEAEPSPTGNSSTESGSNTDSETESSDTDSADSHGNLRGFVVPDRDEQTETEDSDAAIDAELAAAAEAKKAKKGKAKASARQIAKLGKKPTKKWRGEVKPHQLGELRKEAVKNKEARRQYMNYLQKTWEDSAKITKVTELLTEFQATGEKTIIFSQWTSLLDLIECQLKNRLKLRYCCYTGLMSTKDRDNAIQRFVNDPYTTVMLISLKAGNAGLNLTVASRVIICDPFWNPFTEMQAVDRAHRIGQQNEVHVHRILIKDTVEDRILQIQENKRKLVEAALDEGEAKNLQRLSENELRYLFGLRN